MYLWGRQKIAFLGDNVVFFSQFNRKSVYLFPVGTGDKKPVLDALIEDARDRGIPCRLAGLTQEDCALLEQLHIVPDENTTISVGLDAALYDGMEIIITRTVHTTEVYTKAIPYETTYYEDDTLPLALNQGTPLLMATAQGPAAFAYRNIATRLQGGKAPLLRIK